MDNKNSLLIVGSIALDTIETSKDKSENTLGGSTTYSLIAASNKIPVSIVGVVGEDFPQEGLDIYNSYSENLEDFIVSKGKTFRWGGRYLENWDDRETLFTELGVFEDFKPVLSERNKNHTHVFLANIHPDLQQLVIDQSTNPDLLIAIDTMNLWIDIANESLKNVLKTSDILFMNESEALMFTGMKNIKDSATFLLDLGLETVVIKKGGDGAELFNKDEHLTIEAFPTKVIDPTGAGDVFGGAFISKLASGGSLAESLVEGSALASFCVENFGAKSIINYLNSELNDRRSILMSTLNS